MSNFDDYEKVRGGEENESRLFNGFNYLSRSQDGNVIESKIYTTSRPCVVAAINLAAVVSLWYLDFYKRSSFDRIFRLRYFVNYFGKIHVVDLDLSLARIVAC